jgi:biopolymer transport protein ExbB
MQSYSLVHVWAQGDFVTRGIAIVLLAMSLLSWSVMAQKAVTVLRLRRLTKNAEREFWHSDDFASGIDRLGQTPRAHENPFLALALSGQEAADHHKRTRPHLHDQLDVSEWVSRCLNDTIENRVAHLQSGLGVLASIGSTAPFVGLFGTVWGIHRARLTIGTTGASSIDQIAGPIPQFEDDDALMNEINMTPSVDVMLVLVIVFLVAMPAIHRAIKIDVPQAGGSKPAEHPAQLDVSVRADGTLFWGNEPIGENALRSRFEQASHANPQPELRFAADRKVPYERVAEVMSAAQAGGLTKIGFVMLPRP